MSRTRLSLTDPDPNSVYTRTLLPLLKEPGLEITDLAKRLRGTVEALAATVRHETHPAPPGRLRPTS